MAVRLLWRRCGGFAAYASARCVGSGAGGVRSGALAVPIEFTVDDEVLSERNTP